MFLSTMTNLLPISCNLMIISFSLLNKFSLLQFVYTLLFVRIRMSFALSTLTFWNKSFSTDVRNVSNLGQFIFWDLYFDGLLVVPQHLEYSYYSYLVSVSDFKNYQNSSEVVTNSVEVELEQMMGFSCKRLLNLFLMPFYFYVKI